MPAEPDGEFQVSQPIVEKRVPGIGACEIKSPRVRLDRELARDYFAHSMRANHRRFASEVIAALVSKPSFTPDEVESLEARKRSSLRVGVAEAAGVYPDYRRLSGTGLTGDERLFAAMLYRQRRMRARLKVSAARPQATLAERPLRAALQQQQNLQRLMSSPLSDALSRMQQTQNALNRLAGPTGPSRFDSTRFTQSPTGGIPQISSLANDRLQKNQAAIQRLMRSPALEAISETQKRLAHLGSSPLLEAMRKRQERLMRSPALEAISETQKRLAHLGSSPLLEAMRKRQERLMRSPALEAISETQKRLAHLGSSPLLEALAGHGRKIGAQLGSAFIQSFEAFGRFVEERWADFQNHPPEHPPPVMFVVAALPMSLGYPLYRAAMNKREDQLLDLLEPVVTNPVFIEDVQSAIQQAPLLSPISRRHLVTGFNWLKGKQYVDAYPPFYNGLEQGLREAARSAGVIDDRNRFLVPARAKKATKVEDLFGHLPIGHRYRRFLSSWIFDQRGNPFRHGDVSDPEDCRRQSLLLAVAVVGWLEEFGEWEEATFWDLLESEASKRAAGSLAA
jgi:hypothetical protein